MIILYLLFSILTITLLIVPTIWCYNPSLLVNLKYTTNLNIAEFKEPTLFISTHDDTFGHHDQILVCQEAIKTKLKMNIVSWDKEADSLSRLLKKLPLFPKYNLLYTGKNLVQRSIEKLEKEHLWIFLKKDWKNKGIYHILKGLKTPVNVVFVKIINDDNVKKEDNLLSKTFNRKIKIDYNQIDDYDLKLEDQNFMEFVKSKLYDN